MVNISFPLWCWQCVIFHTHGTKVCDITSSPLLSDWMEADHSALGEIIGLLNTLQENSVAVYLKPTGRIHYNAYKAFHKHIWSYGATGGSAIHDYYLFTLEGLTFTLLYYHNILLIPYGAKALAPYVAYSWFLSRFNNSDKHGNVREKWITQV